MVVTWRTYFIRSSSLPVRILKNSSYDVNGACSLIYRKEDSVLPISARSFACFSRSSSKAPVWSCNIMVTRRSFGRYATYSGQTLTSPVDRPTLVFNWYTYRHFLPISHFVSFSRFLTFKRRPEVFLPIGGVADWIWWLMTRLQTVATILISWWYMFRLYLEPLWSCVYQLICNVGQSISASGGATKQVTSSVDSSTPILHKCMVCWDSSSIRCH